MTQRIRFSKPAYIVCQTHLAHKKSGLKNLYTNTLLLSVSLTARLSPAMPILGRTEQRPVLELCTCSQPDSTCPPCTAAMAGWGMAEVKTEEEEGLATAEGTVTAAAATLMASVAEE